MVVRSFVLSTLLASALLGAGAPLAAVAQQSNAMPMASPMESPMGKHHHRHHRHHKHHGQQCRDASGKFVACGFGGTTRMRPSTMPSGAPGQ